MPEKVYAVIWPVLEIKPLKDNFFGDVFYVWISFFAKFCLNKGSKLAFGNSQSAFFDILLLNVASK